MSSPATNTIVISDESFYPLPGGMFGPGMRQAARHDSGRATVTAKSGARPELLSLVGLLWALARAVWVRLTFSVECGWCKRATHIAWVPMPGERVLRTVCPACLGRMVDHTFFDDDNFHGAEGQRAGLLGPSPAKPDADDPARTVLITKSVPGSMGLIDGLRLSRQLHTAETRPYHVGTI